MVDVTVEPERGYTEISRQDSSVQLRGKVRAFWASGEQLWDIDVNNNIAHIERWTAQNVLFWRQNPKSKIRFGVTPDSYASSGGDLVLHNGWYYHYPAQVGFKTYVRCDFTQNLWNGTQWRPIGRAPAITKPVEISFFASSSSGKLNTGEIVRHTVAEPFVILPATSAFFGYDVTESDFSESEAEYDESWALCCNYRFYAPNLSYKYRRLIKPKLYRNGVFVGTFQWYPNYSGLTVRGPVAFASGDVLSINCDSSFSNLAITIVGQHL